MILKVFLGSVDPPKEELLSNASLVETVSAHASAANPTVEVSKIPIAADNSRLLRAVFKCGFIDSSFLFIPNDGGSVFSKPWKQSACQ
jgi:hypothetical protein